MRRPRLLIPVASLATVLAVGPLLAVVALAADPVVVKPGDTLTSIARRHDVSIDDLVTWNAIADPNRIFVGQRLQISSTATPARAAVAASSAPAAAVVHAVGRGESLWTIARRYGSSVAAIASANGIANPSRIFAGQRLTIPGLAAPSAPAPAASGPAVTTPSAVHTVRSGESLWTIAQRYGSTVGAIASANGIANPGRIFAGQRLTIPGVAAASAPSAAPMPAAMARVVAQRDAVRRLIVEEAARYGVPASFALAVAWQESGWQQHVVSYAGAVGVMQLMPATATWVGDVMLRTPVDRYDVRQNVRAGVRLLAHYLQRYDGNRDLVLAAYYQGQWATDHHGVYAVSRPYIASIRALTAIFGG